MGSHLVLMISSTSVLVYSHVLCFSNKILLQFVPSMLVLGGDEVPAVCRVLFLLDIWAGSGDVVAISLKYKCQRAV